MLKGHNRSTLSDRATYIGEKNRYPLAQDKEYVVGVAVGEGSSFGSKPYIEVSWDHGAGSIPYRSVKDMLNDSDFS